MAQQQNEVRKRITEAELNIINDMARELAVGETRAVAMRAQLNVRVAELLHEYRAPPDHEIDTVTGEIRPRRAP